MVQTRLSELLQPLLYCFVMFGAGLIEVLPMAALTGLMIMVAIGTFRWASLKTIKCLNQIFCHACRDTCNYHFT
jgi:SulP family sulfate permease